MVELYDALAATGASLPSAWIDVLAKAVEKSSGPGEWRQIVSAAELTQDQPELERLGLAWALNPDVGSQAIATALRASSRASNASISQRQVELVWTGPATTFIPMRRTEQVVQQVIDSARERLWITSYVFVNPEGIAHNLRAAAARGVEILAVLESPRCRGGAIDHDPARNLMSIVPSAIAYEWTPRAKADAGHANSGCVHAKCLVGDAAVAFITSANLTGSAMDLNMELGVLISSGTIPGRISNHLHLLRDAGVVSQADVR